MSKGERISVIEQARAPDEPSDPNRPMIATAGTFAGAGIAFGLVVLLEVLNKTVRRPSDLTRGLGLTPITTINYIVTPGRAPAKAASLDTDHSLHRHRDPGRALLCALRGPPTGSALGALCR